ncbi:MAG: type III-B CRISPR module RAMP protein Cmr1 [Candidatus Electrothrix sp. MAN1_4]|nr:type III-B CRISPR module RAMP protein Cmr1 [Candidatus Electrothrix sp. MAN1_4]
MRLRVPDTEQNKTVQDILDDLKAGDKDRRTEKWKHSYKIEVITPIFGGGVEAGEPDTKMPVRASAIRGQLRYWWRFLESANRNLNDPQEQKKLFEDECEIWGGMAEEGEDYSSKVKVRVKIDKNALLRFQGQKRQYAEDEPKYALFPAREQTQTVPHQSAKYLIWPNPNAKADLTFELLLSAPKKYRKEIERVLRWWITFGGIGARTRRGCGSVYCSELDPISEAEAEAAGCELKFQGNFKGDALFTWKKAVNCLHKFRQGGNIGRNGRFGRSKWPEPDSIREITGRHSGKNPRAGCKNHKPEHKARIAFPRAAFGLPIIFKFKDDTKCGEPLQTELTPVDAERLASPLILTAYPEQKNNKLQYVPAALLIKRDHLKTLSLMLGTKQIDNWWDESKATFDPIKKYGGTDALTAFINFFANGGE